jgi:hypothetical protein
MATTKRPANRHTVVATGWTNPTRAYALVGDDSYATLVSAKNATRSGDFGFPNIPATDYLFNWISNAQGTTNWSGVNFGNGYWVIVGGSGVLRYKATDPTGAWTLNTQGTVTFRKVAYGNGYWVAVGDAGTLWYKATDPTGAWTQNNQGTTDFRDV